MIFQWEHHILSIEACDAIRPGFNCFISMLIFVDTLCGFAPLEETSKFSPSNHNFSQRFTQPSEGISYLVGDLWIHFTKLFWPSAYTLHSYCNPIPQKDGTNGLLRLVTYISQTGYQCFPVFFCHPTVGNFDISP